MNIAKAKGTEIFGHTKTKFSEKKNVAVLFVSPLRMKRVDQ